MISFQFHYNSPGVAFFLCLCDNTETERIVMDKINYQKKLDKILLDLEKSGKEKPTLLLHACCAPCSSYVLEYLHSYFHLLVYYYNPNISPEDEYQKRLTEIMRFVKEAGYGQEITFIEGPYDPERFFSMARGREDLPEGGERCYLCYELRMRQAAEKAAEVHADYFTTTLSISPHKNAAWINEIGERLSREYGVPHLPSDFKKKSGYLRSIELSHEYGLYRQNYCGCVFSKAAADKQIRSF